MDLVWMREQLSTYLALVSTRVRGNAAPGTEAELRRQEPTVKEILERLDPSLATFNFDEIGGEYDARNAAQRGIGIIDGRPEWEARLEPAGPTLAANQLHHWVWGAAHTFWESNHRRAAVDAAARAVNAFTQTKVGRTDIFDTDLMNQVFTEKPKPGQPYLRLPGDESDVTLQNRNRALRPFAEGCFAGIRNPAAHELGADWDEQLALEYLAAFSVLARWIEECEVRSES